MQPVTENNLSGAEFEDRVISRSKTVPVVVDFWAPWCQPCLMLGPVLERLASPANGAWELVKVDIDREPELARRFRVQSIPAVKGFRDGTVAAEFLGVQPERNIRAFLDKLVPSGADVLVSEANARAGGGDDAGAEPLFRQALAEQPDHAKGLLGLGLLLMRSGRYDDAARSLETIPPATAEGREARPTLGRLRFTSEAASLPPPETDAAALSANPDDLDARWASAVRAAAEADYRTALENFLRITQDNRRFRDDGGRRKMLDIFEILGPDNALSMEYRPQLAAALH
ncbi:MAG: thioredoxin [Chloroflexi bacterium]|nr:thioredoxin [Chloroflexota bacterium]